MYAADRQAYGRARPKDVAGLNIEVVLRLIGYAEDVVYATTDIRQAGMIHSDQKTGMSCREWQEYHGHMLLSLRLFLAQS